MQVSVPDLSDYRLLNAADKLEYERRASIYGNFTGSSSTDIAWQKVYYEKLDRVNAGVNTDWKRLALRTGLTHLHNVMLSGGSRDFRYNVSGNINSTLGIMDESGRTSSSLRINITYGSLSKLFIQNIASFSAARSKDVPYGKFSDYVRLNPYDMPYNADGSLNTELSFNTANPLYEKQLSSYIHSSSDSFIDTFKLRWNIVEGFRAEATLSYTLTKSGGETYYSPKSQKFNTTADPKKKGSFNVNDGTSNALSGNAFLVWNKSWGETLTRTSSFSLTRRGQCGGHEVRHSFFLGAGRPFRQTGAPVHGDRLRREPSGRRRGPVQDAWILRQCELHLRKPLFRRFLHTL